MILTFLKSKVHRATVTDACLDYEGSVSISPDLMDAAAIRPFERVEIYNVTNGERFNTYAIVGKPGEICINGAAAWKARKSDIVIIATYAGFTETEASTHVPRLVYVDAQNKITRLSQNS